MSNNIYNISKQKAIDLLSGDEFLDFRDKFYDNFRGDKDVCSVALGKSLSYIQFIDEKLRDDKEFLLPFVEKSGHLIGGVSDRLKNDKDFVLFAAKQIGFSFRYVNDFMRNDVDVVSVAFDNFNSDVNLFGTETKYLGCDVLKNKDVALKVIKSHFHSFELLDKVLQSELSNDRELFMFAVEQDGSVLQYASQKLKCDKELALLSVEDAGSNFNYVSSYFKDDKDVVLTAVKTWGQSLQYVSERLKNDKDVVLAAINHDDVFPMAGNLIKDDKDFVLKVVELAPDCLYDVSERLKNDREVVLVALKNDINCRYYIGKELSIHLKDISSDDLVNFLEKTIAHDKLNISLIKNHADNKDYVLDALKGNGLLLEYVSDKLKNNPQVCMVAVSQNKYAQKFIGENLKDCIGVNYKSTLSRLSKVKYAEPVEEKIEVKQEVKRKFKI